MGTRQLLKRTVSHLEAQHAARPMSNPMCRCPRGVGEILGGSLVPPVRDEPFPFLAGGIS
jgi:hypothetical protein